MLGRQFMLGSFPGSNACGRRRKAEEWDERFQLDGLWELSFGNCDNRKSHLRPMEEKRPVRLQPDDHRFWSLAMLAVTAGAFLLVTG